MKKVFLIILSFVIAAFFTACSTKSKQPQIPVANAFKFEKIELNFEQRYKPKKVVYQTKEDVEKKLNLAIKHELEKSNLYDSNSTDELKVSIDWRRSFVGEETFLKTDSIGAIFTAYYFYIVRDDKKLRYYGRDDLFYNPGMLGNLKSIFGGNRNDQHENKAIESMAKEIVARLKDVI